MAEGVGPKRWSEVESSDAAFECVASKRVAATENENLLMGGRNAGPVHGPITAR